MTSNYTHQKKIAVINDISGFGHCSITVTLPIISVMKVQCCPLLTSILSNHTGYPSYFFEDYTDRMEPYMEEWKKLNLRFDAISTGFLGSKEQIRIVIRFFEEFGSKDTIRIIDPVMGDHGKTYSTFTPQMCEEMKKLVSYTDILTPNLTEACILTDTPYHDGKWSLSEITALAEQLSAMGPDKVVITGIIQGDFIANLCYEKGQPTQLRRTHKVGTQRPGTGDIFAAIIAADAVNGVPFQDSVKKASLFIKKCLQKSIELDLPLADGVCFEELLYTLR